MDTRTAEAARKIIPWRPHGQGISPIKQGVVLQETARQLITSCPHQGMISLLAVMEVSFEFFQLLFGGSV